MDYFREVLSIEYWRELQSSVGYGCSGFFILQKTVTIGTKIISADGIS